MRKQQEQFVFGSIFLLANQLQVVGDTITKELTLKQWLLLTVVNTINKSEQSVTEIANVIGNTRQNVKQMLEQLEHKGFIIIQKSQTDKRALSISLTEKCRTYLVRIEKVGNRFLDKLFEDVNESQLAETVNMIQIFFSNIEKLKATND